ncbi:MAG: type IV pilus modification PilV family protein [Opitutales bacterium]
MSNPYQATNFPEDYAQSGKTKGLTLVEVMVALGILVFVAISLAQGITHLRVSTRALTYQQISEETVSSYIEQLRAMDYDTLVSAIEDNPGSVSVFSQSASSGPSVNLSVYQTPAAGVSLNPTKHILNGPDVYDRDGVGTPNTYELDLTLVMINQNSVSTVADRRRYISARIDYSWTPPLSSQRSGFREFVIFEPYDNL